jgi:glutathione S-transferase
MGKIPCLEIEAGRYLSESQVILDYLEDTHPEPTLYPEDPYARAKVRELMRVMELYLELPARRLYAQAFFGGTVSDETREQVRAQIEKAGAAFGQMVRFEGHLAGGELSLADLAAVIHLPLVSLATRRIYGEDLLAPLAGLPDYLARLRQRSCVQTVLEGQKQASARLAP